MKKFRILCCIIWGVSSLPTFADSLGVFMPGIESAAKLTDVLKADDALKTLEINVFSKYRDFNLALKSKQFNYIIVSSAFLDFNKSYELMHQFVVGGKKEFQYSVVALEKKWQPGNVQDSTICVVEALDRNDTKAFLSAALQNKKFKRIKNISKADDIYPIMAMGNADLALVSPEMLSDINKTFATPPREVLKSDPVRRFVVAQKKGKAGSVNFKGISKKSLEALGANSID